MKNRNEDLILAFTLVMQTLNNLECALFFEEGRMRMFDATNGKKYDIYKIENEYKLVEVKQ